MTDQSELLDSTQAKDVCLALALMRRLLRGCLIKKLISWLACSAPRTWDVGLGTCQPCRRVSCVLASVAMLD